MRRSLGVRAALASLLALQAGFAWGPAGHQIIAEIAWRHLNAHAREETATLLAQGETLVNVSVWADEVRPRRPETSTWHYINMPIDVRRGDYRTYCPATGCVVSIVEQMASKAGNAALSREERAEALKFLVHFVGDLHQPLHCGDHGDRGGNDLKVIFFGRPGELHGTWDSGIPERLLLEKPDLRGKLLRKAKPAEWQRLTAGRPEDWAWETHDVSAKNADGPLSKERPAVIGKAYQKQAARAVTEQWRRGGLRLAAMLNQIWP